MRAASPLVLVSAALAAPAPEAKLPATKHKLQPTRLSVSCEISLPICTAPDNLLRLPREHDLLLHYRFRAASGKLFHRPRQAPRLAGTGGTGAEANQESRSENWEDHSL